jgi:hypothetical protein
MLDAICWPYISVTGIILDLLFILYSSYIFSFIRIAFAFASWPALLL